MTLPLDHTLDSLQAVCDSHQPIAFLTLGSGMNQITDSLVPLEWCRFADIPGFPAATVAGHRGRLLVARWGENAVLVSEGRLHFYEGHAWEVVVKPIRFAADVGIKTAILTNAAGGIREDLEPGSLMPIRDHLEWNRPHPWREPPHESPYSKRLIDVLAEIGGTRSPGVYGCVTGPSYETPAEIRALRSQGADAVGMSTTREALAGRDAGMEVVALSLITNRAAGLSSALLDHAEVMAVGRQAAGNLQVILSELLTRL